MGLNRALPCGKKVRLYPGDTYKKIALIKNIDDLGFTFEILESKDRYYNVGSIYFISHSKPLELEILS